MQSNKLHIIQKEILRALIVRKWARFRDMRPMRVDSNLYNYHLKLLQKNGMVEKVVGKGYRLSPAGLRYVDQVSLESFETRIQPKLITKLYIEDESRRIVMWPKYRQPFIGSWSLPSGKIHYDDMSIAAAANRELQFLTDENISLEYIGILEINATINKEVVTHVIEHIFRGTLTGDALKHRRARWMDPSELLEVRCSPGTNEVIQHTRAYENFFHAHYDVAW